MSLSLFISSHDHSYLTYIWRSADIFCCLKTFDDEILHCETEIFSLKTNSRKQ